MTNNYEQLQEFLNKCIELGWKPKDCNLNLEKCKILEHWLYYPIEPTFTVFGKIGNWAACPPQYIIPIHSLFSKDSGLMEFIEWKDSTLDFLEDNDIWVYLTSRLCAYYIMSTMKSNEKITYFLSNALLPNKDTNG